MIAALTPIQQEAIGAKIRLTGERDRLADAVTLASAHLAEFENRVQIGIRLALGALVCVLLLISVILMSAGGYRALRGLRSPTGVLGGAFACLILCLGTFLAGNYVLGPLDLADPRGTPPQLAKVDANLEKILADQLPRIAHVGDKAPSGEFALAALGNLQLHEKADGVAIAEQGDAASPLANLAYASLPAQMNRAGDRRFMERLQMAAAVPEKKKVGVARQSAGGRRWRRTGKSRSGTQRARRRRTGIRPRSRPRIARRYSPLASEPLAESRRRRSPFRSRQRPGHLPRPPVGARTGRPTRLL